MAPRALIVNADDYHSDRDRNRGILRAARDGIVTSVTVIANGVWAAGECSQLKGTMGNRVGVHLNLTKGDPLVSGHRTLVNQEGRFFAKKEAWWRAWRGRFDLCEVEAEFAAQIGRLRELGLSPDHLDGNNHIQVFPGIAEVVARLARDFGIARVRLPWEPFLFRRECFQTPVAKKLFFRSLCRDARRIFRHYGLRFPDRLGGIQFPKVSQVPSLRAFLATVPEGTTELMCHPGYANPLRGGFSTVDREQEMVALLDPRVHNDIQRFRIRLIAYQDL